MKRKLQEHYTLLNHPQTLRGWHTTRYTFHSDWCPFCVASRGRSSPDRRVVVNKTADTLPKFQTDYMFIRTVAESKTQPCITSEETRGDVCSERWVRGPDEGRHFEAYGFLNPVILQCDKEMSIIDVCRKVARERNARTGLSKQCTDTFRTRTMLPDTNRDEHWHTAFSNFTCHCICSSLRWTCALKIPTFVRNSVCVTFCACLVNRYPR